MRLSLYSTSSLAVSYLYDSFFLFWNMSFRSTFSLESILISSSIERKFSIPHCFSPSVRTDNPLPDGGNGLPIRPHRRPSHPPGTFSVQKSEQPKWYFVAVPDLNRIYCEETVRFILNLFKCFLSAADLKEVFIIDFEITFNRQRNPV